MNYYKAITSAVIILLISLLFFQQQGIIDGHKKHQKAKDRIEAIEADNKQLEIDFKLMQAGYIEFEQRTRYYEAYIDSIDRIPQRVIVHRYDTIGAGALTRHLVSRYIAD